jgi:hypothetical protein
MWQGGYDRGSVQVERGEYVDVWTRPHAASLLLLLLKNQVSLINGDSRLFIAINFATTEAQ